MKGRYAKYYPRLLKIGIPIMVGQLGTIAMSFADTLMIGWHDTRELSAAGFINNIMALFIVAGLGFSYGLTPIVSALVGEGHAERIAGKLRNSLWANMIVALGIMAATSVLWAVLPWIGMPDELIPLMRPYLALLILSILPQMLFNGMKQFSDGIQDTSTPMWVMLASNVLNVVGNGVLIFGWLGAPEMGLMGAAVATLASRCFLWGAMWFIFHHTRHYEEHRCLYARTYINKEDQRELHRLGWPVALQLGMETASFSLSALYVGWLGATMLAAHQVMVTVSQLFFMLYYGMAAAVAVEVGYLRGTGEMEKARHAAMAGLQLNLMMGAALTIPTLLLRHRIGMWFSGDEEVAAQVAVITIPLILYQIGDAMQCTYANALRGMADVRPMILYAFIAYFIVSLPLGYLFGFTLGWGLFGIWMAFPFGLTTAGILYMRRFYKYEV